MTTSLRRKLNQFIAVHRAYKSAHAHAAHVLKCDTCMHAIHQREPRQHMCRAGIAALDALRVALSNAKFHSHPDA